MIFTLMILMQQLLCSKIPYLIRVLKISFFSFQQRHYRMTDTFVPDYNRIHIKLDPFEEG